MNIDETSPYRRTIEKQESDKLWDQLERRWQVTGGYWYPAALIESFPERIVIVDAQLFKTEVPHTILAERGIEHVFTLFEFAGENEYEINIALLELCYGSSGELYCTSAAMDWLIYASHENTITLAGEWLIEAIRRNSSIDRRIVFHESI